MDLTGICLESREKEAKWSCKPCHDTLYVIWSMKSIQATPASVQPSAIIHCSWSPYRSIPGTSSFQPGTVAGNWQLIQCPLSLNLTYGFGELLRHPLPKTSTPVRWYLSGSVRQHCNTSNDPAGRETHYTHHLNGRKTTTDSKLGGACL